MQCIRHIEQFFSDFLEAIQVYQDDNRMGRFY